MGRFLCIGICTRISVRRDELKYKFENTGQAVTAIRNYFQIEDEELFKVEEYESVVILNISPEILSKELRSVLERFYQTRYGTHVSEAPCVFEAMKECVTAEDLLSLAEKKQFEIFQTGSSYDFVPTECTPGDMMVSVDSVILSLSGKIMMECHGSLFRYLTSLIRKELQGFRLANAIRLYIDG